MPLWGNADDKTSTGTVEIFANGLVTGTTTAFTTEAEAGDYIIADSKKFRILTITDDTTCHVAAGKLGDAVSAVSSGTNYALQEAPIYVSASRVNTDANDVFGVDTTEVGIESANVIAITITDNGSGYTANAAVTISGGGGSSATANAEANATGRIAVVNITAGGSSYETSPTVAIAAPSSTAFNAASAVSNTADTITISSAGKFALNDKVTYSVAAGNTAIDGIVSGTEYFVSFANSTVLALSATHSGANIDITSGSSETGHTLQGETATVTSVIGGTQGVAHAGWVLRTVGTGGRAGRVQYETLVASSSITGDASDDSEVPDA